MKNTIKRTVFLYSLLLLLIVLTFYNSFFRIVTGERTYSVSILIHSFALLIWVITLFIQPFLILIKKADWHKRIGRISRAIVIVIVISTLIIGFELFGNQHTGMTLNKKYAVLFCQTLGMILFSSLYYLALKSTKKIILHIQFITASTIIILGPVIFRTVQKFQLSYFESIELTANIFTFSFLNLLLICLAWADFKKNGARPYLMTLIGIIPIEIVQIYFSL